MTDAADSERSRWESHGERVIYDNPWVRLTQVDVQVPGGERFWHHVVRLNPAAMIVLVDDRDQVLLMWRHRFVADRWGWELPGGVVEAGEDPAATAVGELAEETGYEAGRVEHLVTFEPMNGMLASPHSVFVGRDAPASPSRRSWPARSRSAVPQPSSCAARTGWTRSPPPPRPTCGPRAATASAQAPSTRPGSGLRRAMPGDLAGGDAAYNAKVFRAVVGGEPGAALDAVLANAAGTLAARVAAGDVGNFEDAFAAGLDEARTAVSSGAAAQLLDQWIALSGELSAAS